MFSNRKSAHPSLTDLRVVQVIIRAYLVGFLMTGCFPRPEPVPVEQARAMETRTIYATQAQVMKAAITTLQDLRYSIEVLDSDLGLIVASTQTEGEQVRITEEPAKIDTLTTGQKIFIFAAIVAVVVGLFAIFSSGDDDDEEESDYDDDHGGGWWWGGRDDDYDGPRIHEYRLNINVTAIDSMRVSVRVSGSGKTAEGRTIREAGAIEDPLFFDRFFSKLEEALRAAQY